MLAERAHQVFAPICVESGKAGFQCDWLQVFGDSPYESIIGTANPSLNVVHSPLITA
jgi:hypothetical protein